MSVGQRVARVEDAALVRGQAGFVADLVRPGMVEAVVVRSPEAHAAITDIDIAEATAQPEVLAVFTADDLPASAAAIERPFYDVTDEFASLYKVVQHPVREPVLARDRVRRVGEPVALVVAADRFAAEDARELVALELESLPVVTDAERAMLPDAPQIDPQVPGNLQASFHIVVGTPSDAAADAPHRISARFRIGRSLGAPLENRGVVAEYDDETGLTVWSTTQIPHKLRSYLVTMLGLPESRIRVIALAMGGSFGGGIYPEEVMIPWAAMQLRRPVRWLEDRGEDLMNSRHSRDQVIDAELALDEDGHLQALRMKIVQDCGAVNPFGIALPHNVASHARSVYAIEHFEAEGLCVITNKTRNTPVRGAGRPEATFVIDRLIDMAARRLSLDPAEIRRRNLIPASAMPHHMGMHYRDGNPLIYDSGDFPDQLAAALETAGYERQRALQVAARAEGRSIGIGISCHVEGTGLGPFESADVGIDFDGRVVVQCGSAPHGQSHETVLAQVCSDVFGIDPMDVVVHTSDTALLSTGGGTFGSRSAVTAGSAVHLAAEAAKQKALQCASSLLRVPPSDLVVAGGTVTASGADARAVTLAELARSAGPLQGSERAGISDLAASTSFTPASVTFGSGTHVAVVEVDVGTGVVRILDYTIVDDCGTVLNPTVVEGQQHGGAAHGIGNALLESAGYNEDGQPTNTTFMDYLLPTASDIPSFTVRHRPHPTPLNPLGVKGAGEGATSSGPAAVANAIVDALNPLEVEVLELPITPARIVEMIAAATQPQVSS